MRTKKQHFCTAALVVALLTAGCGTDDQSESPPTAPARDEEPSAELGAGTSTPCPTGSWSPTGHDDAPGGCRSAREGTFVAEEGARAETPCPPGSFAPTAGSRSCIVAPAGTFVEEEGSRTASQCRPGSFSAEKGTEACELAAVGTNVPQPGMTYALPCETARNKGTIWCVADLPNAPTGSAAGGGGGASQPVAPTQPAPSPDPELRDLGVPLVANDALTVTVLSISTDERPGSFVYTISYRLENLTDLAIDEGSFKLFGPDGNLPQYGFFSRMFPTDVIERTAVFEELKTNRFTVLSYHSEQFLADRSPSGALTWPIPSP